MSSGTVRAPPGRRGFLFRRRPGGGTTAARTLIGGFAAAQLIPARSRRAAGPARGAGREREADGGDQVRNESEAGDQTPSQGAPEGFPPPQTHGLHGPGRSDSY